MRMDFDGVQGFASIKYFTSLDRGVVSPINAASCITNERTWRTRREYIEESDQLTTSMPPDGTQTPT